jgi:hypothetical protein
MMFELVSFLISAGPAKNTDFFSTVSFAESA